MRIYTSKGETIEVGCSKSIPKCKDYHFDIKANEKPISFMGLIENKRVAG